MKSLRSFLHDFAEARAMRDPWYAEIETKRRELAATSRSILFLSEKEGLTMEVWKRQQEIFRQRNPWWEPYVRFTRLVYKIRNFPREVKWFLHRGRHGWADPDTYHFSHYLSGIIPEGVARIRERAQGYPADLSPDEWQTILLRIETAFRSAHETNEIDPEIWVLLQKYYFDLWD